MFDYLRTLKRFSMFFFSLLEAWFRINFLFLMYSKEKQEKEITKWAYNFAFRIGIRLSIKNLENIKDVHGLLISNHVSWLEVIVLRGLLPLRHIAKSEVEKFPIIGSIGKRMNTIFIVRGNKSDTVLKIKHVINALKKKDNVLLFPEGTTSDGTVVLPFKISYFQAAIDAEVPIIPIVIRYVNPDNSINTEIAYWKDISLIQSVWKIAKQRNVILEVEFLPKIESSGLNRNTLAEIARQKISENFQAKNINYL